MFNTIDLEWENLCYSIVKRENKWWNLGGQSSGTKQLILNDVSGYLRSGQLVAVLGSSGSGKTTLLSAVSRRIRGDLTGQIFANGERISEKDMAKISAFVSQIDITIPKITVLEHLYFMAQMKMDRRSSRTEKLLRIKFVLHSFGMNDIRNSKIQFLSGGEKRKLNIATEFLTNPNFIFCDEPTTGLDSYNALHIVQLFKDLIMAGEDDQYQINRSNSIANSVSFNTGLEKLSDLNLLPLCGPTNYAPKAIICSIHQPSSEIFHIFTHIILMNSGRIIFQGSTAEAEIFFSQMNLMCPENCNPADFYSKLIHSSDDLELGETEIVNHIYDKYREFYNSQIKVLPRKIEINFQQISRLNWFQKVFILMSRTATAAKRSMLHHLIKPLGIMVSALVIASVFSSVTLKDQKSIQSIQGALITIISEIIFDYSYAVIYDLPKELPIIRRETGEKLYPFSAYYVANFLSLIPEVAIQCFMFLLIASLGFQILLTFEIFFKAALMIIMTALAGNAYGFMLAGISESLRITSDIACVFDVLFLILGGYYINLSSYPYLKHISIFFFGNSGLSNIVWKNVENIECSGMMNHPCLRNGTEVLNEYALETGENAILYVYFGLLCATVIFHLLGFMGSRRFVRRIGFY